MCNQSSPHRHHGGFHPARLGRFKPVGRRAFLAGMGHGTFALLTELSAARGVIAIALGGMSMASCAAPGNAPVENQRSRPHSRLRPNPQNRRLRPPATLP